MDILQQIFIMVVTLGVLIAFHEYGHFWVARRCGVKVLKYSIGFGKSLLNFKDKSGTEYSIAAIPLGGYVKMLDEREGEVDPSQKHLAFNNKPIWKKIAIVAAGPLANFILAIVVYWFIFMQGVTELKPFIYEVMPNSIAAQANLPEQVEIIAVDGEKVQSARAVHMALLNRIGTSGEIILTVNSDEQQYSLIVHDWLKEADGMIDPLASLGIKFYKPKLKPIINEVIKNSPADQAGFLTHDLVLTANGQAIADWQQWVDYLADKANQTVIVEVSRQGEIHTLPLTPAAKVVDGEVRGFIGVSVIIPKTPDTLLNQIEYNPFTAFAPAIKSTWQNIVFSLVSVKKLILGQLSYKQLSGPISIAQIATDSFKVSLLAYLSLLALLSVSLGVLNLLPIPVLDGGHILFYFIEWIKGSPVSEKVQMVAYQIGLAMVLGLMCLAVFNDIARL